MWRFTAAAAFIAAASLAFAAPSAWAAPGGPGAKGPKQPNPGNARSDSAGSGTAGTGTASSGTGIVQAVRPHAVVVRELDGRALLVLIGPRTAVFVNGVRAGLGQVRPGFVVTFSGRAGKAAAELRATGSDSAPRGASVQSVSADAVVVTRPNGSTGTIAVGPRTRVFLNGRPASIGEIRVGDVLVKVRGNATGERPARVLRFRRPG
jgi:hypothetical protein